MVLPTVSGNSARGTNSSMGCLNFCAAALGAVGLLLFVILVPMSQSQIEYYEYGLLMKRSVGKILLDKGVYETGRHWIGPDYTFRKYKASAHLLQLDDLSVFSGDKLDMNLHITIVYFLRKENVITIHKEFESAYETVVRSRCIDAIKNTAPKYKTEIFFRNRTFLEEKLFTAVKQRAKSVNVDVTSLFMARTEIPPKVAERQLRVAIQAEQNLKEEFLQEGKLIRQETIRRVNEVDNQAKITEESAKSNATLKVEKANAEARSIVENARVKGLQQFYDALDLSTPQDKGTLDFIRALEANDNISLFLNFDSLELRT